MGAGWGGTIGCWIVASACPWLPSNPGCLPPNRPLHAPSGHVFLPPTLHGGLAGPTQPSATSNVLPLLGTTPEMVRAVLEGVVADGCKNHTASSPLTGII
jgi:hypothetical protein